MTFEHGYALLIGIGTYRHIPRANIPVSVEDARQVQEVLCNPALCGYPPEQVTFLHDVSANRDEILEAFAALSKQVGKQDTVFLYYSGHGEYGADGNYYLTTHDTRASAGRVEPGTGIREGELLDCLRAIPSERLVFFFNACHAGEISPHLDLEEQPAGPVSEDAFGGVNLPNATTDALLSSGEGRIIVTACREGQKSWIGRGKTSIFARALLDGLRGKGWVRNNAGYVGAFNLYEYLYETVKEAAQDETGQEQEPELTVLKGVGPFPLALYQGASRLGSYAGETLPQDAAARQVTHKASQRQFQRVIQTGGGAYFEGSIHTRGGDVIGGDKYEQHFHTPDPDQAAARQRETARAAYLKALQTACQVLPLAALGEDESTGADITLEDVYVDLETHRPIDLLPDRTSKTLDNWLKNHPEVKLVTRDWFSAYIEAIQQVAPDAIQVTDRRHLVHNLTDAVEWILSKQYKLLQATLSEPDPPQPIPSDAVPQEVEENQGSKAVAHTPGVTERSR